MESFESAVKIELRTTCDGDELRAEDSSLEIYSGDGTRRGCVYCAIVKRFKSYLMRTIMGRRMSIATVDDMTNTSCRRMKTRWSFSPFLTTSIPRVEKWPDRSRNRSRDRNRRFSVVAHFPSLVSVLLASRHTKVQVIYFINEASDRGIRHLKY